MTTYDDRPLRGDLVQERARFTDDRLAAVLRALAADEVRVALLWAVDGTGWDQAAAGAGLPDCYGERVRRNLKRLGARHRERAAAATAVQVPPESWGIGR
jgi:hypothetical protein